MAVIKADPEIGYVDFYCEQRAGMGPGKDVLDYTESVRLPIIRRFLQPYRPDEVRALEARGDSMSKIGIFDRDIVLYVPDEKEGDGVFVISRDNKLQVKRIEFDITDKEIRIISENDRYQPKVLRGPEADSIVVEGKVIGWLHRHPY
jgi:phage repressor protein C with HTH and peptisase S24 domain